MKKTQVHEIEKFLNERYSIRFNVISNNFEYKQKDSENWEAMNENEMLRNLLKNNHKCSMALLLAILKSDFTPKFNPIRTYFEKLPVWDNVDWIGKIANYLPLYEKDLPRWHNQFEKALIRLIAGVLGSGKNDFNKNAIVFVQDSQNSGKTSFIRWLVPPELNSYYSEDFNLADKDSQIAITENIIINIDELAILSKQDITALKAVMSKDMVKVRIPYDRTPSLKRRICTFFATTNKVEFLSDETGNVRWICFRFKNERLNWEYSNEIDINKLWAQAYHLYKSGISGKLTQDEIKENEKANMQFIVNTPEMELLSLHFLPAKKSIVGHKFLTATELIKELSFKCSNSVRLSEIRMGKALAILGYERTSRYNDEYKFSIKGYYVIEQEVVETQKALTMVDELENEEIVPQQEEILSQTEEMPF